MKKIIFFCLLCFCITFRSFAQSTTDYGSIKLEQKTDYAAADSAVVEASKFLLATPIDKDNSDRMQAGTFLIKWMTGTPDYTFSLDHNLTFFEKSPDLMIVYMAAMCQVALHSNKGTDANTITLNGIKLMMTYISNSVNDVSMTRDMKKLKEANDKGQLESFLNSSGK